MNTRPEIEALLERMQPVTLGEMDSIKLMNRIDTKYVTTESVLEEILAEVVEGYRVLVTDNLRTGGYDTLYYDTPGREMYMAHRNGHLNRQKVRTRTYLNSGISFLEVKRKNNHGRTKKKRIPIDGALFHDFSSDTSARDFLMARSGYGADALIPRLRTAFRRITLVDVDLSERVTIDLGVTFASADDGVERCISPAVIIELKQDGASASKIRKVLHEHRVQPLRISKYCIGTVLTCPDARAGRFREKVHQLEKIKGSKI